jgi:ribosomal protein S27AE
MKKLKVNENILALLMFISMFAGWQYMIIVLGFIWAFCEAGNSLQKLTVKVVSVFGGIAIVSLVWSLVVQGIDATMGGLNRFFQMLVSWGVDGNLVVNANRYAFQPINLLVEIFESVLNLLLLIVKVKFIFCVLANKNYTGFWPVKGIAEKIENFANNKFYEEDKGKTPEKGAFCPKCGTKCEDNAAFCPSCGNKF